MMGLLFVTYELGFVIISLYISHSLKWPVTRICGVSMITLGVGCIMFSLPHFLTGLYSYKEEDEDADICHADELECDLEV